jgi:hypothetical protein
MSRAISKMTARFRSSVGQRRMMLVAMVSVTMAWVPAALTLAVAASSAIAGPGDRVGFRGWGPRVGLSLGPDQVVFGAHMDFGYFAEHFRLQPNLEIGVGDGRTFTAMNVETAYRFNDRWGDWSPYAGGGLGLDMVGGDEGHRFEGSNTDLGASALGGIEKGLNNGDRFFVETKIGLADAPDIKFMVGWTFY